MFIVAQHLLNHELIRLNIFVSRFNPRIMKWVLAIYLILLISVQISVVVSEYLIVFKETKQA
jgi:hypothetical protein